MNNEDKIPNTVCLSSEEIAIAAEDITLHKATKPFSKALLMAINAGAFIALAFMFYTTALADGHGKLVGGLCFSLGLMLCVILSGELFTSSTLTLVAKSAGKTTWTKVLSNWCTVYFGNLIGGLLIVFLMMLARQYNGFDGKWGAVVLNTALHKIEHVHEGDTYLRGFLEAMSMGIFCNIMVCVAVWMSFGGKSLTDKMLAMIFPIGMFVGSGFEHSIANMFMVPAGICVYNFAEPEFWHNLGIDPSKYADLTVYNFIVNNLIPVTIGNIIGGGLMVGVYNWYVNCRAGHKKA